MRSPKENPELARKRADLLDMLEGDDPHMVGVFLDLLDIHAKDLRSRGRGDLATFWNDFAAEAEAETLDRLEGEEKADA